VATFTERRQAKEMVMVDQVMAMAGQAMAVTVVMAVPVGMVLAVMEATMEVMAVTAVVTAAMAMVVTAVVARVIPGART